MYFPRIPADTSRMDAGLPFAAGLMAWAGLVGALALQRAQARSVIARYPPEVQAREDFRERYGSLDQPFSPSEQFLSLARTGWSLFFVGFFFVLGLAEFGLALELTAAALTGFVFETFSYPERSREEDDYARQLGVKIDASRLEKARVETTYRVLAYAQSVLWLAGTAFLGYAIAQLLT